MRSASNEAYQQAPRTGAELVEIDVRTTADSIQVAFHNGRVGRLRNVTVHDLTYQELCEQANEIVPELWPVLNLYRNDGGPIVQFDLKEKGGENEVIEMAKDRLAGRDRFVVTTLHESSVRTIKDRYPDVPTVLTLVRHDRLDNVYKRMMNTDADTIGAYHRVAGLALRVAEEYNRPAFIWTVNSHSRLRRFLDDPRVAVVITDKPTRAVGVRSKLFGDEASPSELRVGGHVLQIPRKDPVADIAPALGPLATLEPGKTGPAMTSDGPGARARAAEWAQRARGSLAARLPGRQGGATGGRDEAP